MKIEEIKKIAAERSRGEKEYDTFIFMAAYKIDKLIRVAEAAKQFMMNHLGDAEANLYYAIEELES